MSRLSDGVREYVELRRGLGFKLREAGKILPNFVSFLESSGSDIVSTQDAVRWATSKPQDGKNKTLWARRLSAVRGFARYWQGVDSRTTVPPTGLFPYRPARNRPYIYSDVELRRLLKATEQLSATNHLWRHTHRCLLGLLAVTGLRISEALALKRTDVAIKSGVLTIQKTKFKKSRLIPVHHSTAKALARYAQDRDSTFPNCKVSCFFVGRSGRHLHVADVRRTFYVLSRTVGLRQGPTNQGPRLHDFRHSFAVRTLLNWCKSDEDVRRKLPVLSTYLGHVHVEDTYWYLSAFPELMQWAVQRVEKRWEDQS